MTTLKEIFEKNPDDWRGFNLLHQNRPTGEWIIRSDSEESLALLGLDKSCYSDVKPFNVISQFPRNSVINAEYPLCDISLSKFLEHSLTKQNILKPYGTDNLRSCEASKYYKIDNATIICSQLSIAVLDGDLKIIKECSHNAPEVLLAWQLYNKVEGISIRHGVFASVQQSFNLGHWLIDTLPKIWLATQIDHEIYDETVLLLDTTEHKLIRRSLVSSPFKNLAQTLPFTIYRVGSLIVPVMNSFQQRVACSALISKKIFVQSPYQNKRNYIDCDITPKKIYLSRQLLQRRKIINGQAVDECMEEYGFKIVHPQCHDISLIETLIENAEVVVGCNGAAFCNLIFAGHFSSKKVGIIYPESHLDDYYYRVMSDLSLVFFGMLATNHEHNPCIKSMIEKYYYPEVGSDYYVEVKRLRAFLDRLSI